MKEAYREKEIKLNTDYNWREGWISTSAEVGGKLIAEYVANEGVRLEQDGEVATASGIVPLADWMREHEDTDSVEDAYCNDVAEAYAEFVLDGKKVLNWKSDRGFANSGWYWTDDDDDFGEVVNLDDPDQTWNLEDFDERREAKAQLGRWYAEKEHKKRNPSAFHEDEMISLPDDSDFIKYTF
jgi:hypothetical protein